MTGTYSCPRTLPIVFAVAIAAAAPGLADDGTDARVLVVRERHTASLMDAAFNFKVLKLRGYSIDVRIEGERRVLRLGQSFGPSDGTCKVTFEEISPETRIARFLTTCP